LHGSQAMNSEAIQHELKKVGSTDKQEETER